MSKVRLEDISEDAEKRMVYIARVSNPNNQKNPEYAKLLRYCIEHEHWSVFEHAHMTLEIETSLAIATQILRHRSFTFQQFSARYSDPTQLGFEPIELRRQSEKNRQSSVETLPKAETGDIESLWVAIRDEIELLYDKMLAAGVARECARFILPQCTTTRLYMTGNIRSWIHYIQLRTGEDVQAEHRKIALAAQQIFNMHLPVTAQALGWIENSKILTRKGEKK